MIRVAAYSTSHAAGPVAEGEWSGDGPIRLGGVRRSCMVARVLLTDPPDGYPAEIALSQPLVVAPGMEIHVSVSWPQSEWPAPTWKANAFTSPRRGRA